MSSVEERIIGKILELGVSRSDAEGIVRGLSAVEKSRALRDAAFLQDVCKGIAPAGPVPVPYPHVEGVGDAAGGPKKVEIEGKEASVGEKSSVGLSAGDEAGTRWGGEISKIKGRVLSEARSLLDYVGGMGPAGYKILAITLVVGLAGGYGAGLIPFSSMKSSSLMRIAELEEAVSEQVSVLAYYEDQNQELMDRVEDMENELELQEDVIDGYEEASLELQSRVADLEDRVVDQDSKIRVLQDSLSDAENRIQIYVEEVRVDAENGRIIVEVKNPSGLNAAVTCLALYTDSVSYRDCSEDSTGLIPGGGTIELVWSEEDTSAPSGYVDDDSDYLMIVTTVTGYSEWHMYRVVKMGIMVSEWKILSDKIHVLARNENMHVPFPIAKTIGVSRIGSEDPGVFYNVTDPVIIEEGTLGTAYYAWNESTASAPENFLSLGSSYVIRVTYGEEEQWITWDKAFSEVTVTSPSVERPPSEVEEKGEW